jgi:polyferredoxin
MNKRQKIRRGTILTTFFFFPAIYYYFSPYLVIDATLNRTINGSLIVFGLLFASSLFLGRAFCGWICPAAGCQEILIPVRGGRGTRGDWIKWTVWTPWISAIAILAVRGRGYEKVDLFYQTKYGLSISDVPSLIVYFIVLLLIVVPAFAVGRRSFCHHLCWMAPFMILGRKMRNLIAWPSLVLTTGPGTCRHCHTCTANCPMSLPVESMVDRNCMENAECILCGTCADGCEYGVIKYSF